MPECALTANGVGAQRQDTMPISAYSVVASSCLDSTFNRLGADMTDEFIPDEVEVFPNDDGKRIKLIFRRDDSSESREVVFLKSWLPQLLNQLRPHIAPSSAVQIDKNSLRPGQDFSLQGWECNLSPGGGARLILYIDLPDQGRVATVPMTLDKSDVQRLLERLGPA